MKKSWLNSLYDSSAIRMFPDYLTDSFEWQGHIPFVFWLISEMRPKQIVELGSYKGDSYLAICQAVTQFDLSCKCSAVDTWEGDSHVGSYGDEIFDSLRTYHDVRYASFSRLQRMLFEDAVDTYDDASIDLLHIDGLHTYEAVKADFEMWLPKMSSRGVILFHDVAVRERGFGVWKLWEEISENYPSFCFSHSNGLAVLLVGNEVCGTLKEIGTAETVEKESFTSFFQLMGDRIQTHVQKNFWENKCAQLELDKQELQAKANFSQEINRLSGFVSKGFDGLGQEQVKVRSFLNEQIEGLANMLDAKVDGLGQEQVKVRSFLNEQIEELASLLDAKVDGLGQEQAKVPHAIHAEVEGLAAYFDQKVDALIGELEATRELLYHQVEGVAQFLGENLGEQGDDSKDTNKKVAE